MGPTFFNILKTTIARTTIVVKRSLMGIKSALNLCLLVIIIIMLQICDARLIFAGCLTKRISFVFLLPIDIPHNASAVEFKEIVDVAFNDVIGETTVKRSGDCHGYSWKVTWTTVGGDKSELVPDYSGLIGNEVNVTMATRQDGGVVFGPLTGEFLYLPEKSPQVCTFKYVFM